MTSILTWGVESGPLTSQEVICEPQGFFFLLLSFVLPSPSLPKTQPEFCYILHTVASLFGGSNRAVGCKRPGVWISSEKERTSSARPPFDCNNTKWVHSVVGSHNASPTISKREEGKDHFLLDVLDVVVR